MRIFFAMVLATGLIAGAAAQAVFINEIHYDNTGGDVEEGVEIAGPAGTDLSAYTITPYNGSGGAAYSTTALSGTIPDEGNGFGAVWFAIAGLQNGAPDGVALDNGALIEFLSYEGSFTATDGPANGVTSTDIGVAETSSTPLGESLQRTGNSTAPHVGSNYTWAGPVAHSRGLTNAGQEIPVELSVFATD